MIEDIEVGWYIRLPDRTWEEVVKVKRDKFAWHIYVTSSGYQVHEKEISEHTFLTGEEYRNVINELERYRKKTEEYYGTS